MKNKIVSIALLAIMTFLFASCLNDDDERDYTYYSDTAITAFSLGTMNMYLHTISSEGEDSIYKETYTGSTYKFYIDHQNGTIYNPDSLPYGTDAAHVLVTISSKNNGIVLLKSMEEDEYTYYSSADSIDFSTPRILRVLSQNGAYYRDYTVTVNVHQQKGDDFSWSLVSELKEFASLQGMKLVTLDEKLYLFGFDGTNTQMFATDASDGTGWAVSNGLFGSDAWKNVVVKGGSLFVLDGTELRQMTGTSWSLVSTDAGLKQLIGASSTELYALAEDGGVLVSKDDGATWKTEILDDDTSLLPIENISYSYRTLKTNKNLEQVMVVGKSPVSEYAVVWTKLVDVSDASAVYPWTYVDLAGDMRYALPLWESLTVFPYDGINLAFGFNSNGEISPFRVSRDGGITWKEDSLYSLPSGINVTSPLTAAVDADNQIWIVGGGTGQVWRGRLNRLGWTTEQKYFGN
ncbi:MAG: exo-alpha-sialidase [Prevotella sp.]|nr:exo-alpha-sialidase [Prevotella sp.]